MAHRLRGSVVALALLPALPGCSSIVAAVTGRSVQADEFEGAKRELVVMTMTGERRVATVRRKSSELRVCAESLPDAAQAVGARSAANVSLPGAAGARAFGAEDQFATALLQTFNRTETADVVRQLGWQICQAWSNGAIGDAHYYALLADLIVRSTEVLKARASGAPAIAAGTVNVPLAPQAQPPKPETTKAGK